MIRTACRAGRRSCLPLSIALACSLVVAVTAFGGSGAWWNDAVFYEVFVRSSCDHDAGGIEDPGGASNLTLTVESTRAFLPSPPSRPSSWSCRP